MCLDKAPMCGQCRTIGGIFQYDYYLEALYEAPSRRIERRSGAPIRIIIVVPESGATSGTITTARRRGEV